ncbi:MAG: hypothetical protein IPK44_22065 [Candidatus Accumulibacter sp.]|jgi:tetratricopeptide (TPR) repeat protein|uniref:tetratricopeptide repeat protein n=1 Tax=Accumulibacter sp. TaxID=2053492 RepID=UPI0025853490|nr:hypothetical protein [Accumulibacter sp.]MBK8117000.1 hypothetical protein [Accumulibacter sp.]
MTESFMGRRGFWQTIVNHRLQAPTWRSTQQVLKVCCAVLVGLGAAGESFGQRNNVEYPDWATRFPAVELYEPDCGPLYIPNKYGPFDYRALAPADRDLVERAHFSYEYEAYLQGKDWSARPGSPGPPAGGFAYTLWAFPNQLQVLAAMEDLGFRQKTEKLRGSNLRVHCYFQRAVRFVPEDAGVRALYGYYYARRGKPAEARKQLEKAEAQDSAKVNVWLYLAFAYLEIKDYEKSLTAAKRAYAAGYSLPGLRRRLERAGAWRD